MSSHTLRPEIAPSGVSYFDPDIKVGVRQFQLSLDIDGHPRQPDWQVADPAAASAGAALADGLLALDLRVETVGDRAIVLHTTLRNTGDRPFRIGRVNWGKQSAEAGVWAGKNPAWALRYCHTDNVRTENYPYCQPENAYVRAVPRLPTLLGGGEDQAFPAILLTDRAYKHGLVIGATDQSRGLTTFSLAVQAHCQTSACDAFAIHQDPVMTDGFTIAAGAEISLDGVYIGIRSGAAAHPNVAYHPYIDYLTTVHDFRGPTTPLLKTGLHCTWNYGVFDKQYQDQLLETAAFIADNFPGIGYFLVDAGYVHKGEKGSCLSANMTDRFYPDVNAAVDREKFPDGIRAFSDKIRGLGLKPGIWWSPTARVDSPLFAEHPDWFLRDEDGEIYCIAKANGFLDLTVPAAYDYIDRTLAVILGEWGMDALKMDFWSHMTEDRSGRLADPQKTVIDTRTALFEIVRRHLPDDGVFMTCVATGMGNPFIGQWADTYRNTIDIGIGVWREQIMNCIWALPTLLHPGRRTFLLNNDSVGVDPSSSDDENYFRFTWMHMTMGLIETGGEMQKWDPKFVDAMRRLTDRADRGHAVRCLDDAAFTGEPLPEILAIDYPADSRTQSEFGVRQNLAFFNWSDEPKLISLRRERLGPDASHQARDFWTDAASTWSDEFITVRLAPHAAALYDIST